MTVESKRIVISESELKRAINAYGLVADSIERMAQGCYALVYKIRNGERTYVVRIRSKMAKAYDVIFARKWGQAVSAEVRVPVPLAPVGSVPRVANRCVEVVPYIEHDTDDHAVGPEAWITIGEWVGRMHRLGIPLSHEAPVELPYGNYPHDALVNTYRNHARSTIPRSKLHLLRRAEDLLTEAGCFLQAHRGGLESGVIHGDMHFWNVLYTEGNPVAIIDLDFLQRGYLISDLAYACIWLAAWEHERGGDWCGVMRKYLAAYEYGRQKPLSEIEKECLPWFRVLTHIFFFFQVSWDNVEADLVDLEAAEKLIQSLHT